MWEDGEWGVGWGFVGFPAASSLRWGGSVGLALNHLMLSSHIRSKMSCHGNPTVWLFCDVRRETGKVGAGRVCPVERIIEWRRSGAYRPSRGCVLSMKYMKKQTLRLFVCLSSHHCYIYSCKAKMNELKMLSVWGLILLGVCVILCCCWKGEKQNKNLTITIYGKEAVRLQRSIV